MILFVHHTQHAAYKQHFDAAVQMLPGEWTLVEVVEEGFGGQTVVVAVLFVVIFHFLIH